MKKVLILMMMALSVVLVGCSSDQGGEEKVKVVYSIPGLTGPIWNAASEGFKEQCDEFGWECSIVDPNDNLEQQISMLDNQLNDGVDGLVVTAIDGQSISPILDKYKEANIPVVAIDRQVVGEVISTVEADNYKVGYELGEMYVKDLDGKEGEVLIIGGPLSSSATVLRTDGFKAALEGHDNITIVGESATEFENELALAAVSNYLQGHPNINGIFSCTDTLLPAVITGLSEANKLIPKGKDNHVKVYSVDGDSFGLEQVTNGNIDATYGLDPYTWAKEAAKAIKTHMDGNSVEESILVGGRIVTKENYEELKNEGVLWGAE